MLKTITINAIIEYIENNLELTNINTDTLVNYSGYSRRYLQILFSKFIGIPIGKYIQMRRVTRAAILLRFTNLSITDISERLLYDSQQTFTREFKKNSGYTPLQYRKSNLWHFNKILGRRTANYNIPVPTIRVLKQKKFNGAKILFKTIIPSTNPLSKLKWDTVDFYFSKEDKPLYISHKLESDKKDKENMYFNAIFWDKENNNNANEELAEGFYAYFSFTGNKDEYKKFTYNIYMSSLPFYGLTKKDSYDLEIIEKIDSDTYHFEYFLPIRYDKNIYESQVHNHSATTAI
ncbi:helix-turn-helix domain-containing protein [Escherichia coli]|uniref:helix-turn-helix domain-containing protein n=1 Tax=Escherichia coli TaxID=562 RepID=UPI001E57217C|nr:helix-turn-helix domain-containing protein [Escherichia coli]